MAMKIKCKVIIETEMLACDKDEFETEEEWEKDIFDAMTQVDFLAEDYKYLSFIEPNNGKEHKVNLEDE